MYNKNAERHKGDKMSFEYIQEYYGLELKKNQIVKIKDTEKMGVVTKATAHVFVRLSGEKVARPYHPYDIVVIQPQADKGETR